VGISAIEMAEFNPPLHDAHAMRVLFMIPVNPSPTLTYPEHWSPEFNSFLQACLEKDPVVRSSSRELLRHAFIVSKSNTKTLFPYLEQTADYVNSHGGSLDEALKAIRLEPSDSDGEDCGLVLSDVDEADLFQDFSDADADLGWVSSNVFQWRLKLPRIPRSLWFRIFPLPKFRLPSPPSIPLQMMKRRKTKI
jgi:serine/threonine protein kinase